MNRPIRTRFAPAPTGLMHLGNVRTALINYLFARQKGGTCVLRIEDTDAQRNFDPGGNKIMEDLEWLGLSYDETPAKGGAYGPYIQSQRTAIYAHHLRMLIEQSLVYECFCTAEELEKKRQRQLSLKMPPRYDRTCLKLSPDVRAHKRSSNTPFIWRFELDQEKSIIIQDIARDNVQFHLKNFSDLPLTRTDGSFTFMFTNCVDDITMHVSHIFRGEDHLTNTAGQAALFQAFKAELPIYWHMPILCNTEGKKLSKRDFGFALNDLRNAGYLPEAICNYLGTIGGGAFTDEIMGIERLVSCVNFEHAKTAGHVRYDTERLVWINHTWIQLYSPDRLTELCLPFLHKVYPDTTTLERTHLTKLIQTIKSDLSTLKDVVHGLHFYFVAPEITPHDIQRHISVQAADACAALLNRQMAHCVDVDTWLTALKNDAKQCGISFKEIFSFIRLALTGHSHGPAVRDLIIMLGVQEVAARLSRLLVHYG